MESCSQRTFILDQLRNDLGTSARKTSTATNTINEKDASCSTALDSVEVPNISLDNNELPSLPRKFTKSDLLVNDYGITKPFQIKQWKYL